MGRGSALLEYPVTVSGDFGEDEEVASICQGTCALFKNLEIPDGNTLCARSYGSKGFGDSKKTAFDIIRNVLARSSHSQKTIDGRPRSSALQAQQEHEKGENVNRYWNVLCCCTATLSLSTALISMVKFPQYAIKIAFLFPLITAPWVVIQRGQLNRLPYLRESLLLTKARRDKLTKQNLSMRQESLRLEQEVKSLRQFEHKAESLVNQNRGSIHQFSRLAKENGHILRQIKRLQECEKLQDLVELGLNSDRSGAFQLDEEEMEELLIRLQNSSSRKLDEHNLRKNMIKYNNSSSISCLSSDSDPFMEEISEYEPFPRAVGKQRKQNGRIRMLNLSLR